MLLGPLSTIITKSETMNTFLSEGSYCIPTYNTLGDQGSDALNNAFSYKSIWFATIHIGLIFWNINLRHRGAQGFVMGGISQTAQNFEMVS